MEEIIKKFHWIQLELLKHEAFSKLTIRKDSLFFLIYKENSQDIFHVDLETTENELKEIYKKIEGYYDPQIRSTPKTRRR